MSTTLPTAEPPQEQASFSPLEPQAELDRQDAALHDLLMRRAELAQRIAGVVAPGKPAFRPGYEADMVRRLVRRHAGGLPRQTVVRIWRELITDCLVEPTSLRMAPGASAGAMVWARLAKAPTGAHSTTQSVIRDVGPLLPEGVEFVPAHPLAGTEFSGPDAGFATLFEGRWCLLTPLPGSDPDAVEKIAELWRRCGSMVEAMEPSQHDRTVAIISHLPHLIAFTICGTADDLAGETQRHVLDFAASGFRDFTRIAASDPVMWRDVFLNNREALLEMLARFMEDAQAMARAVRWGDAEYIENSVKRGRAIRRRLIEAKQA
jgi:cyclohexadieny/prephenate dehydrogenase